MPRTVDHAQRRAQITDALVRVAAREGLHAVTMRSVAAASGVSLRLVQYYFDSKAQLVRAALERLEAQSYARWAARLAALSPDPPARAVVEACLAEALPTDAESRAFHVVWTAYASLAMTDPSLAEQPFADGPRRLERELADVLERARCDGELVADAEPAHEAARLLALGHGLGTSVLVRQRSADDAADVLRYHVDRLFTSAARRGARGASGLPAPPS